MSYNTSTNSIKPNAEQVDSEWKVVGIKANQGFEHRFKTREEAQGFIKGFTFAFLKNLI